MSSFSTKDFKTIVRKIQTETESINSLISFDDESYLEEKMCEIRSQLKKSGFYLFV